MKTCEFCAELIQDEAIICRFCGKDINSISTIRSIASHEPDSSLISKILLIANPSVLILLTYQRIWPDRTTLLAAMISSLDYISKLYISLERYYFSALVITLVFGLFTIILPSLKNINTEIVWYLLMGELIVFPLLGILMMMNIQPEYQVGMQGYIIAFILGCISLISILRIYGRI